MARARWGLAGCALLACAVSAALHAGLGDVDLNLADEGFLWYGVLRTLEGQVALRDFQSYDPGRYLWCAAWCAWLGQGVLALRAALAAFGALGLLAGLCVLRRVAPRPWALAAGALVLSLWMFPRHKLFEPSLAMLAVLLAVRLAERPSLRRHLASGVAIGLTGLVGRNHVLYGALGFGLWIALLALWLAPEDGGRGAPARLARRQGAFAAGGVVGMLPLLGMLAFVPGFGRAYLDSVLFFSREHGTNLPLPYPWPWRFGHATLAAPERVALAAAFLLPLVVVAAAALVAFARARGGRARELVRTGGVRVLLAASAIGVFYAHHASVRSDAAHLAQSLHPALLGALALPAALGWRAPARAAAWAALLVASWLAASATNPVLAPLRAFRRAPLVACQVAGERLRLAPDVARQVELLTRTVAARVPADEALFLAPGLCTLYPAWGRVSPVWGIYFLWPASEEEQRALLADLEAKDVRWALIKEAPPDGRADLLFQRTHALVWAWLERRFERVPTPELPPNYFFLRRRER